MAELPALASAAAKVRTWFRGRLDDQSIDIARLYRNSRDSLEARLRIIYEQFLAEDPTLMRARTGPGGPAIEQAINQTVGELSRELGEQAVRQMGEELNLQPRILNRYLARVAKMEFRELPISTQGVLNELTTRVIGGGTFMDRLFHQTDSFRNDLFSTVRQSLINGDDFATVRARVHRLFGVDKLAEPEGYAQSSVKTYRNEALRQWNLLMGEKAEETGGVEVWWAKQPFDDRHTPGCVARHGRLISEVRDRPPRHFNCRCEILIVPPGTDLDDAIEEANAWLLAHGYTRRRAAAMEALKNNPSALKNNLGWAWGQDRIVPLYRSPLYKYRSTVPPGRYSALPWRELPALTIGRARPVPVDRGAPDHVLLRVAGGAWEVLAEAGWRPVRTTKINVAGAPNVNPRWIETSRGFALDSPEAPAWDPPARRLPLDLLERWPAMRRVALPAAGPGERYALRLAEPAEAEAATLGRGLDAGPWALHRDLEAAFRQALGARRAPADPHLVLAVLAEATWDVPREALRVVVALGEGRVLYARDPFPPELEAPYRRVAVAALDPPGVWAVRPRGRAFWALPGGHIAPGEAPPEAAEREMAEETGVQVRIVRSLGTIHRPWATTEVFLARRVGMPQEPAATEEIDAVQTVPPAWLEGSERTFLSRHLPAFASAEEAVAR